MECVDVALIVALDEEYQAIRRALGISPVKSENRTHRFELSEVGGPNVSIVIHVTGEMGLVPTANATDQILSMFKPKWLISIGISGQLSGDCALGDVVVGTACDLAYNEARLSADKIHFGGKEYEVSGLTAFRKAVDLSKYLQGRELTLPAFATKMLTEKGLWRKYPRVHSGIVCSTDFVVDDPKIKDELLTRNRRFLCADMECAAMVSSAKRSEYSGNIAIIRAISDPADGTKKSIDGLAGGGVFRLYAMKNATTVLYFSVLQSLLEGQKAPRFIERPLVAQAVARLGLVGSLLQSGERDEIILNIDTDPKWQSIDTDLAKFVYRERISRLQSEVPKPLSREIAALAENRVIDFYVALHVMRSLSAEFESHPELLTPLTHVHTHRVNQYCKALMESAARQQRLPMLLQRINTAYDVATKADLEPGAKANLHAHLCYLLGRVTSGQSWQKAAQTLQTWRDRLVTPIVEKKTSTKGKKKSDVSIASLERLTKEHLLQYRTIQISLTQLGVEGESDRYIQSCIASPALDAQNRGFHLEYYGDIPYDPAQPLSNEDRFLTMPKTLTALGRKLLEVFQRGGNYPLRDIDLYTVISLLRSRLQLGVLDEQDREHGLRILSSATWMSSNRSLPMLLDRIRADLVNAKFHPINILDEIYNLKKLRRTGWSARGRNVCDPETVGSHTFGGLTLIELFLPETKSPDAKNLGGAYSKEKVMRLFLKHDWAEAIIGDLLPDQKNEEKGVMETIAVKKISSAYIYHPYVNRQIYEDWDSFENGVNINARLARDVDLLDNLRQLVIEDHSDSNAIPDYDSWVAYIKDKISTDWGRSMFAFFQSRGVLR